MDFSKSIEGIREHIKAVYLTNNRPLIVGFSGGKDSSAATQLLWEAIEGMPRADLCNDIHIISTDTLVEMPYVIDYIKTSLNRMNEAAQIKQLPIRAHQLRPTLEDSYWVNLIGKGYPAPSRQFRWCTERLKIEPVNRFIEGYVSRWGEVTVVLGARRHESATRTQVLNKKKRDSLGLSRHPTLPAAYVFTPIEDLTTDDVWTYLLSKPCPWGMNNRDLAAMYQNASSGECPIVIDNSTPSCGNSRFGCWVCTLVRRDTTMENLIDSGEDWMTPLLEFRNLLSETQDPAQKPKYRSYKRRDGRVSFVRDKTKIAYGPYKLEWRKEFLRRILQMEKQFRETAPDKAFSVISIEELQLIRQYWREEEYDWEDSVPRLYNEITGINYPWHTEDGAAFSNDDLAILDGLCRDHSLPVGLLARLVDEERRMQGISRRAGIIDRIDAIFEEEWRSEQEITDMLRNDNQQNIY